LPVKPYNTEPVHCGPESFPGKRGLSAGGTAVSGSGSSSHPATSPVSLFLDEVADQIAYRPLRSSLCQELREHIQDLTEEYESQGMTPEAAQSAAVCAMGDPLAVGAGLNEVHRLRHSPALTVLTLVLLLIGFAFSAWMQWSPEQSAGGFLYYLPGTLVLAFTAWKGCPLAIRRHRLLLILAGLACLLQVYLTYRSCQGRHITGYYSLLMLGPVLVLLAYKLRRCGVRTLLGIFVLCFALLTGYYRHMTRSFGLSGSLVLAFTLAATFWAMIHRGILDHKPGTYSRSGLYGALAAGILLMGGFFVSSPERLLAVRTFVRPEAFVHSTWEDSYNNVLIRELLSRTPAIGGLDLSSQELMDYGTGAWYFADRDPLQIGMDATGLKTEADQDAFDQALRKRKEAGGSPRFIHFDQSSVTLWDILPQHYHNNYLIAVTMLLYGRLFGVLLVGIMAGFYLVLFACIRAVRGKLAFSLACSCGFCLLGQSLLYVLGNLGYQYANFTSLPMISEGRISMVFNMALLGFVFSAYRYDRVVEEHQPPSPSLAGR
jgi:hypothetical protein